MTEHPHLHVALLCFPGITQLDMTGPYEVLVRMPDTRVHIVWKDTAPVRADRGLRIVPDLSLQEAPKADVLVVPGGPGVQNLMEDDEVLDFLRTQAETARYVVSVCTGSLVLGAARLLDGYRATCHWLFATSARALRRDSRRRTSCDRPQPGHGGRCFRRYRLRFATRCYFTG